MTRSEIKRLCSDILDCNENDEIQKEYLSALRNQDIERLQFFASFGETVRHRVMNVNDYRHGLNFGFTKMIFSEYGWLQNEEWINEEEIAFKTSKDKASYNHITIAMGLNGKWSYGVHYSAGSGAGGGYNHNVYDQAHNSRKDCIKAGVNDLKNRLQEYLERDEKHRDPSNFNSPYMRQVLALIEEELGRLEPVFESQLSLF
ncbi:MAG: hypothetical protein IM618_11325 [Cytophagales bacterium]|nr:hypothetical protein [Cytophagales bacterium]